MKRNLLTTLALMAAIPSHASISSIDDSEKEIVSANLFEHSMEPIEGIVPENFYHIIGKADNVDDLYAVEKDGDYLFTNRAGNTVFLAPIYDLVDKVDLMEEAQLKVSLPLLGQLTQDDVITYESTDEVTNGVMYVFSDPTCFYCVKLHDEIEEINAKGYEVRIIPFIRSLENREAEPKILDYIHVMGISDKKVQKEKYDAMIQSEDGLYGDDEFTEEGFKRISESYMLGVKSGLTGTPLIITSGGNMHNGLITASQVEMLFPESIQESDNTQ
ncbi:exported hypothetical protein [Vibrio chagasii]|nr:exported hypothetical protein [Vibrio chagasii]